jgi:hypothetical protein
MDGEEAAGVRNSYANRLMAIIRRNVGSPRRAQGAKSRMQEPVWDLSKGDEGDDRMGEATTKRNTMNVPMCKLQAERTEIDGRSSSSSVARPELSG